LSYYTFFFEIKYAFQGNESPRGVLNHCYAFVEFSLS